MKAILLAAGRGERLKPLTDAIPKPLLQVGSRCLIDYHLKALSEAGIQDIVINVAYKAKDIIQKLGNGEDYGVHITYSYEDNGPMGTGGGIYQALPLLGEEPFIVVSSDVWTEFSFAPLLTLDPNDAHLVMVDNPDYYPSGDFCLLEDGKMTMESPRLTYGNIAVLHPRLFAECQPGNYSLAPLFHAAIEKGTVTGEYYRGSWYNVGTPHELKRLQERLQVY